MATLVLTVVGGLVGGPVGAAVGAAIGQQVDAAIFKPKGREGPRLADLKVQASTYGQHIPQMFGTMRVAGSVIWATDLIERRNKRGGGKGRPATTEYSYSVSLAVALSSRPIRAIHRIWADGNLLRGSSGSFQERCVFRWHDGGEDQAADPLIASAVGIGSASAFRGLAYAVFEELELASFGNRIPSLTFEVEADADDVDAGLIADGLLDTEGRCAGRWRFGGYAASGDRARDALAPLFEVDAVRLVSGAGGWMLAPSVLAGAPLTMGDFAEARRGDPSRDLIERQRASLSALPGAIRLRHYEPGRDYQLGQQTSAVAGGGRREERIDLPAVLAAGSARALAAQIAAAAADGRETLVMQADLAALALPVGAAVALTDGSLWRLAARTVRAKQLLLELRRHQPLPALEIPADPGVPISAPDWPDATGVVRLFDLPSLGSPAASTPRIVIAGAGDNEGWRGADSWFVATPGSEPVPVGLVRPAAALGMLTEPLAAGSETLFDLANRIVVTLVHPGMTLESVDDARLLSGANRAMIGDEILQFGIAEALDPGVWRLSRLLRGRAGTESALHASSAAFVLLDDAALTMLPGDLANAAESGAALLQWASRGRSEMTDVAVPGAARALQPLAPVHGRIGSDGAGGAIVDWVRRSRVDAEWRDYVDQPLGEGREAWRIALSPPVAGVGPWERSEPALAISAADLAAIPPAHGIEIRQIGDFSVSPPLALPLT